MGLGNPILTDDAVGVRLARALAPRFASFPGLTVVEECSAGGLNLLDLFAGYERAIVLDAIRTAGGVPGDWYTFDGRRLRETMHLDNIHDANFATALELGRRMGQALPPDDRIHIFAVEVQDDATFGESMTPALEAAFPSLVTQIGSAIASLLA